MNTLSPEVLIYVQNLKKYFHSNVNAQKYFTGKDKEDVFFEYMSKISQKNFEESGEPELTPQQFEEVREKITGIVEKKQEAVGIFISFGEFGYISLN
jgi:hypothetical protein